MYFYMISKGLVLVRGCRCCRKDQTDTSGGGMMVYVRHDTPSTPMSDIQQETNKFESIHENHNL